MSDKTAPKYKKDDIVYDREMHIEYVIRSFAWHQLNGDAWYHAYRSDDLSYAFVCQSWLTLIKKADPMRPNK